MTDTTLDKKIDAVLRNPKSDNALRELVDCLPQESRDTLKTIMQTVLSNRYDRELFKDAVKMSAQADKESN